MIKKILKYKWYIFLIILSIVKIIICANLPMFYINGTKYDDLLMLNLEESIRDGKWLGKYNDTNLTKGIFFPLLLSFFNLINLPTSVGLSLIYVLSCVIFCFIIRNEFTNKKILYLLYILLLFNPISFSSETFERLYRYGIGPSQILLFLAFLYGIYKNLSMPKKMLPHLIFLGITVATIVLTREDYLFIIVLIITSFSLFIIKLRKKSYYLLIFIIVTLIPIIIVKTINYHYYGKFILNDLTETHFKDAYIKMLSVNPDKYIYRVSIPRSSLKKIITVSPTLQSLKNRIDNLYMQNEETIDGHLFWIIKTIERLENPNQSLEGMDKFWEKVDNELAQAFKDKKLEKRITFSSLYLSPPNKENIVMTVKTLPKTIWYILTYDEVITFDSKSLNKDKLRLIDLSAGYAKYSKDYFLIVDNIIDTEHGGTFTYEGLGGFCNIITFVYKHISIVIIISGMISYIILIIKKLIKRLFLSNIIFICLSLIILGITYTDVTAFDAIRYFYLAPVYSLLIAFSIITINTLMKGIHNERIRFNNINALFKRRSKYFNKHNKS